MTIAFSQLLIHLLYVTEKRPSLPTVNETSPLESQLFISAIEESWKSEPGSRLSMEAVEDSLRQGGTTNEQDWKVENDFCFEK